jgi:hypothetical protein
MPTCTRHTLPCFSESSYMPHQAAAAVRQAGTGVEQLVIMTRQKVLPALS